MGLLGLLQEVLIVVFCGGQSGHFDLMLFHLIRPELLLTGAIAHVARGDVRLRHHCVVISDDLDGEGRGRRLEQHSHRRIAKGLLVPSADTVMCGEL